MVSYRTGVAVGDCRYIPTPKLFTELPPQRLQALPSFKYLSEKLFTVHVVPYIEAAITKVELHQSDQQRCGDSIAACHSYVKTEKGDLLMGTLKTVTLSDVVSSNSTC